jgi:hypothetical protein
MKKINDLEYQAPRKQLAKPPSVSQDLLVRAEALRTVGVTFYQQGDLKAALKNLDQSLVAFQSVNGQPYIPKVLFEIGTTHKALGEHALAEKD